MEEFTTCRSPLAPTFEQRNTCALCGTTPSDFRPCVYGSFCERRIRAPHRDARLPVCAGRFPAESRCSPARAVDGASQPREPVKERGQASLLPLPEALYRTLQAVGATCGNASGRVLPDAGPPGLHRRSGCSAGPGRSVVVRRTPTGRPADRELRDALAGNVTSRPER